MRDLVLDPGRLAAVEQREQLLGGVPAEGGADRETLAPGRAANLLQLHQDFPTMWDAWDVDDFYRNTVTDLTGADSVEAAGDGVRVVRSAARCDLLERPVADVEDAVGDDVPLRLRPFEIVTLRLRS